MKKEFDFIHTSKCHDCNQSYKYSIKCEKCEKKHCDGEYTEQGIPWQLPGYRDSNQFSKIKNNQQINLVGISKISNKSSCELCKKSFNDELVIETFIPSRSLQYRLTYHIDCLVEIRNKLTSAIIDAKNDKIVVFEMRDTSGKALPYFQYDLPYRYLYPDEVGWSLMLIMQECGFKDRNEKDFQTKDTHAKFHEWRNGFKNHILEYGFLEIGSFQYERKVINTSEMKSFLNDAFEND